MIQYDSNLQDELYALLYYYEKLRDDNPKMERKYTIYVIMRKILNGGLDYIKLPNEYKKKYDFYKSEHQNWNHAQLMARTKIAMVYDDISKGVII